MGVSISEIKTRSGKDAAAEFGAFFDWFYAKIAGDK